ncbi:unnamed protein product [Callosobruchus maculatus]|uniref:Uncharacterized protein n=1 Tax=Callosobruchus maculatus TaxID=64391 RepID=A0A653BRC6_CALMS|nr:unnamed protein product [Callosobruchus maculatus]
MIIQYLDCVPRIRISVRCSSCICRCCLFLPVQNGAIDGQVGWESGHRDRSKFRYRRSDSRKARSGDSKKEGSFGRTSTENVWQERQILPDPRGCL